MALIDYKEYIDFEAFQRAIIDLEKAFSAFGTSSLLTLTRLESAVSASTQSLRDNAGTLQNFNVNQKDAVATLQKMGVENDALIKKQQQEKDILQQTANIYNTVNKQAEELKSKLSVLLATYQSLTGTEAKDIAQKKQLANEIKQVTGLVNTLTGEFKRSATSISAAEGSYARMQQELKALGAQLRALPNAFDAVTGKINKNNKEAVQLSQQYTNLSNRLKQADATMGVFTRNVGNYGSALSGLGTIAGKVISTIGLLVGINSVFQGVQFIFQTNKQLDALNFSLKAVTKTQDEFSKSQEFLARVANTNGLSIVALTQGYKLFYAAATETNITAEQTRTIFEQVSRVAGVLKLSSEDTNSVFLAFEQIASKGVVSMEELRKQLGQYVPGVFNILAKSLGVTTTELNKMIKSGTLLSSEALPKLAEGMLKAFGGNINEKIVSLQASTTRFNNALLAITQSDAVTDFFREIVDAGTDLLNFFDGFNTSTDEIIAQYKEVAANTERYTSNLVSLITQYDILQGKTSLNADEQENLKNIIAQVVTIVPDAATEIDKYGNALDINKVKVVQFINAQNQLTGAAKKTALTALNKDADEALEKIKRISGDLQKGTVGVSSSSGIGGAAFNQLKIIDKTTGLLTEAGAKLNTENEEAKKSAAEAAAQIIELGGKVTGELRNFLLTTNKTQLEVYEKVSDLQNKIIQKTHDAQNIALSIFTTQDENTLIKLNKARDEILKEKIELEKQKNQLLNPQLEGGNNVGTLDDSKRQAAANKAQAAFARQIKDRQDALQAELELELKQQEELLVQGRITESSYLLTRYNLTKDFVQKATELELRKGKEADSARLSDLRKMQQDSLNDYTKAYIKESGELRKTDIELQQKQIESDTELQVRSLKNEEQIEINTKVKINLEKERLEVEYQNKIDRLYIDSAKRRAKLEQDPIKKQELDNHVKALEQGIKARDEFFESVTKPNEFYKLGVKFITDEFNLRKATNKATLADEIAKYDKLIELAKIYNKDYSDLEQKRNELIAQKNKEAIDLAVRLMRDSAGALSEVLGSATTDFFNSLITSIEDILNDADPTKILEDWASVAVAAGNAITQASIQASEQRIAMFEAEKERELTIAGDNADAQVAIEAQFQKRVATEKRKQAVANKLNALFEIAINTAVGVTSAASTLAGLALVPFIIALGAAEAALVIAAPIPKFKKGTDSAPEGLAMVDEAGTELIVDKQGRLREVGTEKGARLTYLSKGDRVITHQKTKEIFENSIIEENSIFKNDNAQGLSLNSLLSNKETSSLQNNSILQKLTIDKTQSTLTNKSNKEIISSTLEKIISHNLFSERELIKTIALTNIQLQNETLHRLNTTIQQNRKNEMTDIFSSALQSNKIDHKFLAGAFEKAVKNIPLHQILIDEKGQRERWKRGNDTTTYYNSFNWKKR